MVEIDLLRQSALDARVKGIPGGNRVVWQPKDIAILRNELAGLPEDHLRRALDPPTAAPTLAGPSEMLKADLGVTVTRAMQDGDLNFLFVVSSPRKDLAGDTIDPDGIDASDFVNNPTVLNSHDSTQLPIANSTKPWVAAGKVMAIAKFPEPRVSFASDKVAAAIRANLVRGASVGFVPLKWSLSKDPARPLGIDFHAIKLLEWSICSVPCNPDCIAIGSVSAKALRQSAHVLDGNMKADHPIAIRIREAQELTSNVQRFLVDDVSPPTREQRMAEAARLSRAARGGQ